MKYQTTSKLLFCWGLAVLAISAVSPARGASEVTPADNTSLRSVRLSAKQVQERTADQQLQESVENALNSDYYFYAVHVTVSIENGNVKLQGFVFSDWDLRDAIRIATKAAGGRRVVDDLTIEVGGRR
jgi:osmotically-inducible protein OsmY